MVVSHFNNGNCGYLVRVHPSIRPAWERLMVWCENQPVGMHEIDGVLLAPPTTKLMASLRPAGRYQQ